MNESIALAGTKISHTWTTNPFGPGQPDPSYVTVICDDETLVWNNVTDPASVASEAERYVRTDLADGLIQVSWKESPDTTNFGLIWTLNFKTMEINGVLVNADPLANLNLAGHFTTTTDISVEPPLQGC